MKKAVIFDMDGLMIDSETVTYDSFVKVLHDLGHDDFTLEMYCNVLGKRKPGILDVVEGYYPDIDREKFWVDTHILLDDSLRHHVPKKKGLDEILAYCRENGLKVVVATSSERARVQEILTNGEVWQYVDDAVCADDVTHGKPDPETFLKAVEKAGVDKDECIVLEDSESGIECAYRGGIDVICVLDKKYPGEDYASKPIRIVDSLLDVIEYLKEENA